MANEIYMDNAATSWPKPECVAEAMTAALKNGGNPGRGGHRLTVSAGQLLYEARDTVAEFFACPDPFRVSFSMNITMALNTIINGILQAGDAVLVSPLEHNAVMRPLQALTDKITWEVMPHGADGLVDCSQLTQAIRPNTKLMIVCHESNVNGLIQPIRRIGQIAHEHNILFLADCAQSAGSLPLDIEADAIDILAFTGHKGLMGPTGTGGFILGSRVDPQKIHPLLRGGTGSLSESFEQPAFLPDRFESGTPNVVGLAGLSAGIRYLMDLGVTEIHAREQRLISTLIDGLTNIPGLHLFSAEAPASRGSVISFNIDNVDNGLAAQWLEERYGIMTRIGLHCAPLAHRTLGTFPNGTIRFSISPVTSEEDILTCIRAIRELSAV